MNTTPIYIPLTKGLDLSTESVLGLDGLMMCENVQSDRSGRVRGRPEVPTAAPSPLIRSGAGSVNYVSATFTSANTWQDGTTNPGGGSTTYQMNPRGIVRHRDLHGEASASVMDGRLIIAGQDRGPIHCAKVDRVHNFQTNYSENRLPQCPRFGIIDELSGGVFTSVAQVLGYDYTSITRTSVNGGTNPIKFPGNGVLGGSVNTVAALVGKDAGTNLKMCHTEGGATTVYTNTLASDCATPADLGDAPAICKDYDVACHYVAYKTTTANQYKVLRITVSAGTPTITHTFTGTLTGLNGIWVCNSPVADDRVLVALTNGSGMTIKVLLGSTLVDQSKDSTVATAQPGRDVVIGWEAGWRGWWAFRSDSYGGSFTSPGYQADLLMGTVDPRNAASCVTGRTYFAGDNQFAGTRWSIAHQPVKCNGRMYITLVAGFPVGTLQNLGTWTTLDLSNWKVGSMTDAGPFTRPSLVARGPSNGTSPWVQPSVASVVPDGPLAGTYFTFPTIDWEGVKVTDPVFGSLAGVGADIGINKVSFQGARSVVAGDGTLYSGSVPHQVAGGECSEVGFPFMGGQPGALGFSQVTGTVAPGDYTISACWVHTDNAGQTYRSAPSQPHTFNVPGSGRKLTIQVSNPWLTERGDGDTWIEVYSTTTNPTANAAHYLQTKVVPDFNHGFTTVDITATPVSNTQTLYTDGDSFIHAPVPADGGLTILGGRVWMASTRTIYASLLRRPGEAYHWNDEGPLQVTLPAGAGHILALETLQDKVIVLCERGVYAIQDGGPDNVGVGPDISTPVRISDVGLVGPRSSCAIDGAVIFVSIPAATFDGGTNAGPWLLDSSLIPKHIGGRIAPYMGAGRDKPPDITVDVPRQRVFLQVFSGFGIQLLRNPVVPDQFRTAFPGNVYPGELRDDGVVVMDLRTDFWSLWTGSGTYTGAVQSYAYVDDSLQFLQNGKVRQYSLDVWNALSITYTMYLATHHLASTGLLQNNAGWSRVRSMYVGMTDAAIVNTTSLNLYAILDRRRIFSSTGRSYTNVVIGSELPIWPTAGGIPIEWRLPMQKCSSIQCLATCSHPDAEFSFIRLDVLPKPGPMPAYDRK